MGFFDRLFGKKPNTPAIRGRGKDVLPPPDFDRAVEMQRAYWTHDAEEQAQLEARSTDPLDWRERLRLHHLICLQRLIVGPAREATSEKCRQSVRSLIATDSPYRPQSAMIWQGQAANGSKPNRQGEFLNPSLTHLGCLEIYRVDAAIQPTRLDFVGFNELSGVMFASPNMLRAAKLFYNDGRDEIVLFPMLYGTTWTIGNERERAGSMTRFVAHLDGEDVGALGASGIGVGQQDFSVRSLDGGSLFGLGSVAEISFPLDMRDPGFDAKARARGIDPDEVRRKMGKP